MALIFDIHGENLDQGYINLQAAASRTEQELREMIEAMWERYEPYAGPDFRQGFARDIDGRFWEMYIGCTLLEAGQVLLPVIDRRREGGQPDLCVVDGERRIWIEAIAPHEGAPGPDQVVRPTPINEGGRFAPAPVRQAQLRMTSAFWTKAQRIADYLEEGVIAPNDVRIIAICASRFGAYVSEDPPLILTSLFPIGEAYVTIDRETGVIVEQGFQTSPTIERDGPSIPRSAFLDGRFADISGVLWSRIGIGNLSREVRPLSYVHNPMAQMPLPTRWGVWDREFVTRDNAEGWQTTDILASEPPSPE